MIEITLENFQEEVITASLTTPILVDFWAPWCGPCKTLGPILEKVEEDYAGRFKLAKIDTEAQPQLAQAFGIRSVPTVILLMGGQPVDGFAGAVPESQVKAFLDRHLPSEEELQTQADLDDVAQLAQAGDSQAALGRLADVLAANPGDNDVRCQYVELLLSAGQIEQARQAWEPLAPLLTAGGTLAARPAALQVWLQAKERQASFPGVAQLQAAIEQDKRDFDARYMLAQYWLAEGEKTKALDELLQIITRSKDWNEGDARKMYVGILELMTPQQAQTSTAQKQGAIALDRHESVLTPEQKQVADYRRRLSMALN